MSLAVALSSACFFAYLATSLSRLSSRSIKAILATGHLSLEGNTEASEQCLALLVSLGRCGNTDIESTQGIHLVVFNLRENNLLFNTCLLYTSDAADDLTRVDLGGRRIIKK